MDKDKGDTNIVRGEQCSSVSIPLKTDEFQKGSWKIDIYAPYGFRVKNLLSKDEFHFDYASNGWITGVSIKGKERKACTFNASGRVNLRPVLFDEQNIKARQRVEELRKKKMNLTEDEAKELLRLCGIIKGD